ncbi:hypothetical protein Hdeb2414_s0015g00438541 [Helianthus debilis subsp. tardiflorus]
MSLHLSSDPVGQDNDQELRKSQAEIKTLWLSQRPREKAIEEDMYVQLFTNEFG